MNSRIELSLGDGESRNFGSGLVLMVIFTLLLSLADGALTLKLVESGVRELNPVMNFYLESGAGVFISVKYLLTSLSLLLFVIFKDRTVFGSPFSGLHLVYSTPFIYAFLIGHQLSLLGELLADSRVA